MDTRLRHIWKIYKDGVRVDWTILGADAVGIAIVGYAFFNARSGPDTVDAAIQLASAAGF